MKGMKAFHSRHITRELDADAEMSFGGKWLKLNLHEDSVGATFLLMRSEAEKLRDFIDEALKLSEPTDDEVKS